MNEIILGVGHGGRKSNDIQIKYKNALWFT